MCPGNKPLPRQHRPGIQLSTNVGATVRSYMKAEILTRKRGMGYKFMHEHLLTQVETEITRINLPEYSMSMKAGHGTSQSPQ